MAQTCEIGAFLHLIHILIENYLFYGAVLDAIEEAEDAIAAE